MWKKIVEYFLSCFPSATFLTFSKRFMIINRLSSDKELSLFAGLSPLGPLGPLVHSHFAALPSGAMQTIDAVRIRWQKVPQQTERVTSIASCFIQKKAASWWWSMISQTHITFQRLGQSKIVERGRGKACFSWQKESEGKVACRMKEAGVLFSYDMAHMIQLCKSLRKLRLAAIQCVMQQGGTGW